MRYPVMPVIALMSGPRNVVDQDPVLIAKDQSAFAGKQVNDFPDRGTRSNSCPSPSRPSAMDVNRDGAGWDRNRGVRDQIEGVLQPPPVNASGSPMQRPAVVREEIPTPSAHCRDSYHGNRIPNILARGAADTTVPPISDNAAQLRSQLAQIIGTNEVLVSRTLSGSCLHCGKISCLVGGNPCMAVESLGVVPPSVETGAWQGTIRSCVQSLPKFKGITSRPTNRVKIILPCKFVLG